MNAEPKTLDVSNIRYSDRDMFIQETKRGYQYFLRYSGMSEFYSTSRQELARHLPDGINIDRIAPKKSNGNKASDPCGDRKCDQCEIREDEIGIEVS